ncbi:hypothetical protein [Falsiroseomonas ponticola]|uniref:hypothetical protein n=1 Tax=Falsiroseomonas ponticola TaxID=2786951 RepID=UPI0019317C06|nr:hypothetical protein [Roseomonas ponticola]
MISMNSLAAFTAEVSRMPGLAQVRGVTGQQGQPAGAEAPQRKLESLPAMPSAPTPRGSLLDLRV